MNTKLKNKKGFTLSELMMATAILVMVFSGVLTTYFRCMELSEQSRNVALAMRGARNHLEAVRNSNFSQIVANYNNVNFTIPGLNGIGTTYVDSTNPKLYYVWVSFCWREKNGRIMGEDLNLDGALAGGEDLDGNGFIDSPVVIVTGIYNRST